MRVAAVTRIITTTTSTITATSGPAAAITTTTPDPAALLRLLAWLSPAFPTGGFAWSHGLEWAVEAADVRDTETLFQWTDAILTHGSGRSDAILLRHAHRAAVADPMQLAAIAELAVAIQPARERLAETIGQGTAFAIAATAWDGGALRTLAEQLGGLPYPVAVGALAGGMSVPEDATALAFLHGFAANLISAAVRLVPLGQSAGLAVQARLEPILLRIAADTRNATLDALGGAVFRADIGAMRHETQYTRLFRS